MSLSVKTEAYPAGEASVAAKAAFEVHGLSHPGLVRVHNEDSWFADADLGLAMVADGVGGHANGARASQDAVQCIAEYVRRASPMFVREALPPRETQERAIARAIALANRRLVRGQCGR